MKYFITTVFLLLTGVASAIDVCVESWSSPLVNSGDNVILIGDSITDRGFGLKTGYYHLLTNAVPEVNWIPLGFSGYQLKTWMDMERDTLTNTNRCTWYRGPTNWNLHDTFAGKVDVIVIFLGMNDILEPSIHDTEADIDRWASDYRTFVDRLNERCHPRLFVFATITPLTTDLSSPKNIVREKLNARMETLAASMPNAVVVYYGSEIEGIIETLRSYDPAYRLVPDFVHPNDLAQYSIARALCAHLWIKNIEVLACRHEELLKETTKKLSRHPLDAWVVPSRVNRADDSSFVYMLGYSYKITSLSDSGDYDYPNEWRLRLPEGWTSFTRLDSETLEFVLRGRPEKAMTPIIVEAVFSNRVEQTTVNIPAPWRVADESGIWKFYTATLDYTGGATPGSIDPFQTYFGWKENTITAARRVWSEKARDVKAILSHQTFSATLDLTVKLNGQEVWKDNLNRNGKNRVEKTLHLNEGWNDVEITCVNHNWQRQFAFDLEPLEGDSLENLKYDIK